MSNSKQKGWVKVVPEQLAWLYSITKSVAPSIYYYLTHKQGGNGDAWPSVGTIAKGTHCNTRTAQRALRQLETLNLVKVETRGGGKKDTNRYHVLPFSGITKPSPRGGVNDTPQDIKGVAPTTPLRVAPTTPLRVASTPPKQEPLEQEPLEQEPIKAKRAAKAARVQKKKKPVKAKNQDAKEPSPRGGVNDTPTLRDLIAKRVGPKQSAACKLASPSPNQLKGSELEAFVDWLEYRKQIRKPITQKSIEGLVRKYTTVEAGNLARDVQHSINNAYQGLFAPKAENTKQRGQGEDWRLKTPSNKIDYD